jgi:hypothetical protein
MLRVVLVAFLLSAVNAALLAQPDPNCEKCCGYNLLEETSHRGCYYSELCHVTKCSWGPVASGCCVTADRYNDVCAWTDMGDWYHYCNEL